MSYRAARVVLALVVVSVPGARSSAQVALPFAPGDRTLAPYFEVEGNGEVDRLPLRATDVEVHIAGVVASVVVRQIYENEGDAPVHARYVFPASTRAAVSGMRMRIGPRVVEAVLREKERARRVFERAKREGRSAALLEERRPNVFEMGVANILPGDRIEVELRYSELIVPTDGVYEFVFPTTVAPRYDGGGAADADESATGRAVRGGPDVRREPGDSPAGWNAAPVADPVDGTTARFDIDVTVTPGLPLRELHVPSHRVRSERTDGGTAKLSLETGERWKADRDFVLRYRLAGAAVEAGLVLQEHDGERFFLLLMEPPARVAPEDLPPREYVFVVDVSGSMRGFPLDTAKGLLRDLVLGLGPRDRFNVLLFAGGSRLMAEQSLRATRENLDHAVDFIDAQRGGGGTELGRALERALDLPRSSGASARSIVLVTDGHVTAEESVFRTVRARLESGNVFAFGIGSSVNRFLVEGVARAGLGEPFVVTDASEAAITADRFRRYITSPVLTDIRIDFEGFDAYDVTPGALPDLFAERPLVVQGKWRGRPRGAVVVTGVDGRGAYRREIDVSATPRERGDALPQLWARTRIGELSDPALQGRGDHLRDEIVRLGLRYGLLTRYTSFVAVDRVVRTNAEGVDVEQPRALPHGMDPAFAGRTLQVGSEPTLWLLLATVALLLAVGRWSRRRRPAVGS